MDARFLGFCLDFSSEKLDLDMFMQELSRIGCHDLGNQDNNGSNRKLYINSDFHDDFYLGMIITIRNQKKFCKGNVREDDFTFDVLNLKKAEKVLEFNYFIICKDSGLGLYQHYHQSCAPRFLGDTLKFLSKSYWSSHADSHIASEEIRLGKELSNSQCLKVRKQYRIDLKFSILVRQDKLQKMLEEYSKIKSFEFEYAFLTPDLENATPLASHVLKKKEVLRFHTPTNVLGLASSISNFINRNDIKSGKVKVEDEFGEEFPLKIFNMPDYFEVYDFDALADKLLNIKASEFYRSELVDMLISCFMDEKYEHIFQVKIYNEN